jgi:light-regulated signal transduction histidine kinase (bacteriophytochrome)
MTALIDALLMLSRFSRESMTFVPFSLSAMAHEICERLQQASPARYATITIGPDIEVTADPRLLRIALENLLGNAWKYTSKRDHASITLGVLAQGGETVYYLQDNGAGFDMAHRERLFTPFQRLHRERDFPGTGIGLATVQRIIHRHGGRIWADGQIGQGATFYFTLNRVVTQIAMTETRA